MFAQCLLYSGPGLCRVVRDSGIYYTHTRPINRLNTFSCVFSIPAFTSFFSGSLLGLFSFLRGLRGPKVQYWLVILIPILIVDQIKKLSLCIGNKVCQVPWEALYLHIRVNWKVAYCQSKLFDHVMWLSLGSVRMTSRNSNYRTPLEDRGPCK